MVRDSPDLNTRPTSSPRNRTAPTYASRPLMLSNHAYCTMFSVSPTSLDVRSWYDKDLLVHADGWKRLRVLGGARLSQWRTRDDSCKVHLKNADTVSAC